MKIKKLFERGGSNEKNTLLAPGEEEIDLFFHFTWCSVNILISQLQLSVVQHLYNFFFHSIDQIPLLWIDFED